MVTQLSIPYAPQPLTSRVIRTFRAKRRINQRELAEILGVSEVTISSWENENTKPPTMLRLVLRLLPSDGIREFTPAMKPPEHTKWLKTWRGNKRLYTVGWAAHCLGISRTSWHNWEAGIASPPPYFWLIIQLIDLPDHPMAKPLDPLPTRVLPPRIRRRRLSRLSAA
jgi:DNA-binding transcriptional regulator YiaG